MSTAPLQVLVRAITYEAEGILSIELVHPAGRELPAFTAGAHLDVHMSPGLVRQYSLCNDPAERLRYVVAVLYEPMGKGGSKFMHEQVRPGDTLYVSAPRNYFPLAAEAKRHLLLAGGVGITPMMAMVAELVRKDADFTLHYCTRSPEKTAFRNKLLPLAQHVLGPGMSVVPAVRVKAWSISDAAIALAAVVAAVVAGFGWWLLTNRKSKSAGGETHGGRSPS